MRFSPIRFLFALLLACPLFSAGQTNPAAQTITYSENFSTLAATSTTYPTGIQGWSDGTTAVSTYRTSAPTGNLTMIASGDASMNSGGVYNYNGKIGFLTSGSVDPAICFAVNTTGLNGITMNYDVMTIRNPYDASGNTRINEVTLQYRVGTTGTFTSVGSTYQNNTTLQTGAVTTPQNSQSFSTVLPAACDGAAVVQLRLVARDISGAGGRPSFAFDNIVVTSCTTNTSTYYYRSRQTGNWSIYSTWEASPNGITGWTLACSAPTSAAAAVTIVSGHTVTINTNATAPNITVNGTLTFDNTARAVTVTDYINVTATGTFITQVSGTATHTLSMGGDLTNNGIFDMSRGGVTLLCNLTFTKNGNQNVTGTGSTTRFSYIALNMGTSNANILDISTGVFAAPSGFLHPVATSANGLLNGTLKMSGSFTYTGALFKSGAFYNIVSTAGVWINNANVTISATNDSYDVSGILKISAGTFNAGSTANNAIRLLNGSAMTVSGGTVNAGGRIQAYDAAGTTAQVTTYTQSGGTVVLSKVAVNTSTMPEFTLDLATDSLIFSGGTMIFHNQASVADDLLNRASSVSTGGLVQMGDATTASASAAGFYVESYGMLPNFTIYPCNAVTNVVLATNLKINGNITIGTSTKLNNKYGAMQTYNITLSGNWINNGLFLHNNVKGVTFNGSSAQNIMGSNGTTFNNLTINNSLGGVTMQTPDTVNASLILSNGLLYTSSTNLLYMNTASSVGAVSNASFVYGPVRKTGTSDFIFPVGKDLEYRPIAVTTLSGAETFTAEYFHSDPGVFYSQSLKDPTLATISGCEYWMLTSAGSATANVTLSWDSYSCGVTSLPDLEVARWNGSMWKDEGNTGTTGSPDPGTGTVMSVVESAYGPYTLASTLSTQNPLPVELLSFTAAYTSSNSVNVKWSTASETNNDYFTVERSADAAQFDQLAIVDGAGNSDNILKYATTDHAPLNGVSYYRLKQTDFDGHYKYSATVSVKKKETDFDITNTYFQETQGALEVHFNCNGNCLVYIDLYDMSGQKVYSDYQQIPEGDPALSIPAKDFAHGIYLLKVQSADKVISRKIKL